MTELDELSAQPACPPSAFGSTDRKRLTSADPGSAVLTRLNETEAGELLTLQRASYLDQARLHDDYELPPLVETLDQVAVALGDPEVIVLGLRLAGRLVGSVRLRLDGATADLARLMVAPDLQGRGLGTRLLADAEAALPAQVKRIELFTGEFSLDNLRLYQRVGYVEYERRSAGAYQLVFLARTLR